MRWGMIWTTIIAAVIAIAGGAALAAPVGVVTLGMSAHPWDGGKEYAEAAISGKQPKCGEWEQATLLSVDGAKEHLPQLNSASAVEIDDATASKLTGLPVGEPPAIAFVAAEVAKREALRQAAYEKWEGGWSLSDEQQVGRLWHLLGNWRRSPPKTYLVRALVGARDGTVNLIVRQCDGRLLVETRTTGLASEPDTPHATAAIVFVPTAPAGVDVVWLWGS